MLRGASGRQGGSMRPAICFGMRHSMPSTGPCGSDWPGLGAEVFWVYVAAGLLAGVAGPLVMAWLLRVLGLARFLGLGRGRKRAFAAPPSRGDQLSAGNGQSVCVTTRRGHRQPAGAESAREGDRHSGIGAHLKRTTRYRRYTQGTMVGSDCMAVAISSSKNVRNVRAATDNGVSGEDMMLIPKGIATSNGRTTIPRDA